MERKETSLLLLLLLLTLLLFYSIRSLDSSYERNGFFISEKTFLL